MRARVDRASPCRQGLTPCLWMIGRHTQHMSVSVPVSKRTCGGFREATEACAESTPSIRSAHVHSTPSRRDFPRAPRAAAATGVSPAIIQGPNVAVPRRPVMTVRVTCRHARARAADSQVVPESADRLDLSVRGRGMHPDQRVCAMASTDSGCTRYSSPCRTDLGHGTAAGLPPRACWAGCSSG